MGDQNFFLIGLYFWFFVGGIATYFSLSEFLFPFLALFVLSIVVVLFYQIQTVRYLVLTLLFFTSGLFVAYTHEQWSLYKKYSVDRAETIEGIIIESISCNEKPWQIRHILSITKIDNQKVRSGGLLCCTTSKKYTCQKGDILVVTKKPIKHQRFNADNSEFDWYSFKEGISGWLFVDQHMLERKQTQHSWIYRYFLWMHNNVRKMYRSLKEPARTLYGSIFLATEKITPNVELKKKSIEWGIVHYLARSGLHIMLFILLWKYLFMHCFGWLRIWAYGVIPFVFLYVLFTPLSISFMRGVSSFILLVGGMLFKRPHHMPHVFIVLAFIFLLYNPYLIFFLDFQLSFCLTYTLLVMQEAYYAVHIQNKTKKQA